MKRRFTDAILFSTDPKYLTSATARAERERVIAERNADDGDLPERTERAPDPR